MSVGYNIRNIRTLRGMTQKELGLKAGFSNSTADVRIRQYESGKMVPKEDKLNDIAKALDVDVSALEDHNITSDNDVMHIFFELEDNYGLKIGRRDDGKAILYFDEKHALGKFHDALLDHWCRVQSSLNADMEDSDYQEKRKEYDLWKCRYPLDMYEEEDATQNAISEKYKDLLYNVKTHFKIKRAKEFVTVFEKLLKTGFELEIVSAPERSGLGQLVCAATFKSSQLLNASEDKAIAFAEYLAMTSQLNDMGIEIERNCNAYYGEIVYINYFYSSMLSTALNHVVREMIAKYQSGDFDDDLYQMQYQDSLQTFDVPIEDAR